jgi:uncharacterized membrane protein
LAPIAILAALYYRIAGFERSIPVAGFALLLAVLYALATEALGKRAPRPGLAAAGAIFATGAVAALALALTLALEKGWLTVALALMVPGIAWVAEKRPLPWLRWLAALLVVLVIARIGWEPRIVGRDVGTTPIFNWLLYGYGVPAAAFWLGGYLLRRRADDVPARMTDAAAILFTVLFAFLEIRHYVNDGDIYRRSGGLNETALQVCAGLAIAIGLERVRGRTKSVVHDMGAVAVAALVALAVVWRLLLVENPWWNRTPVGGMFFNLILLGYGIPAVLAGVLALVTRQTRPEGYRTVAAVGAVVLALVYLSLEVTRAGIERRLDRRRGAIHLLGGVARFRRRLIVRGNFSPLAAGTDVFRRGGDADGRQGVRDRSGGACRRVSRAVVYRIGRGAGRHRLALSTPAVPAARGQYDGARRPVAS